MLKAILVEDNPRERRTVINTFEKIALDIELAADFDNGESALEWLRENDADILISDIQMPKLTGIDLLKALKSEGIEIKSILISCYDSFDYAKEAISLGVIQYVLKPILKNDLENALNLAYSKCVSEHEDELYQSQLRSQIGKVKYILQEQFLRNLLFSHSVNLSDIELSEKIIDLNIISGNKFVAAFKMSKTAETKCDLFTINCAVVDEILSMRNQKCSYYPYILSEDMFTVVFCFSSALSNSIETIIRMKNFIEQKYLVKLIVGISNGEEDATKLNSIYIQAIDAVNNAIGNTKNFFILYDELDSDDTAYSTRAVQAEIQNIFSETSIDFSDKNNAVKAFLNKYLLSKAHYSTSYIHTFSVYVITLLQINLAEYNKSLEDIVESKLIFDKLAQFETIQNVYFWLENNIRAALEIIQSNNTESKNSKITKLIKDIIAQNYKSRLTINDIAEKVHFSSKQAHRIFLKETGETILDYLTSFRMQKAKEYLAEKESKLYLAAQAVGYKNKTHFNETFRQYTGLTPQEYKQKHEEQI